MIESNSGHRGAPKLHVHRTGHRVSMSSRVLNLDSIASLMLYSLVVMASFMGRLLRMGNKCR